MYAGYVAANRFFVFLFVFNLYEFYVFLSQYLLHFVIFFYLVGLVMYKSLILAFIHLLDE